MASEEQELIPDGIDRRARILQEAVLAAPDTEPNPDYRVLVLETAPEVKVSLIVISEVNSQLLVAVPGATWHRTASKRILPNKSITKPIGVAVASASVESVSAEPVFAKVWIAFLNPSFEECIDLEAPTSDTYPFAGEDGGEVHPWAEALVEVADQKFGFVTAASQPASEAEKQVDAGEKRLQDLEASIAGIQSSLQSWLDGFPLSQPAASAPRPIKANPKAVGRPAASTEQFAGLDSAVVQSALAAGVPAEHLKTMSNLAQPAQKNRLGDLPTQPRNLIANALGETDEEAEENPPVDLTAADEPSAPDPMQAALLKLTRIVETLSDRKKPKSLSDVLDDHGGGESGSLVSAGSGSHRRHVAVLKALQKSLLEQPGEIIQSIEKNMLDDFGSRAAVPGEPHRPGSYRGWVEHRSRIPNIPATVRIAWSIAGALDASRAGRHSECEARLGLLLSMIDQVACDRGSWLLASELALESQTPPFSAFARHVPPEFQESPHTRLVDPRWIEALMYRVREMDDYAERRVKLGKGRRAAWGNDKEKDGVEEESKGPNRKKKGKEGKDGKDGKGDN